MKMNSSRRRYVEAFKSFGKTSITNGELIDLIVRHELPYPQWIKANKIKRGLYDLKPFLDLVEGKIGVEPVQEIKENVISIESAKQEHILPSQTMSYVPMKDSMFVPFGSYGDIKEIIASKVFYPVYITGLSGNGKTFGVEQACAALGRELVRANITGDTDEDDLIGGYRLIDGNTVWQDGPVVTAMKRGAVLLLDEVDLGTPKIMCLQPVLEGKAIYIKKTNQVVVPKKGFNVFATANTKGTGSSGGSFIGTMILNEAFLERFAITIEQEYPPKAVEIKIINRLLERGGEMENDWLAKELVDWANGTRDGYLNGSTFELISTRRLVHIVNAYMIFKDIEKALDLTLSRFEKTTKEMFKLAFMKIHDQAKTQAEVLQRANRLVEELPDPDEFTPVSDAAVLSAMGGDAVAKQFQKSLDAATNQAFGEMKGHGSWATMIANS